MLLQCLCTESDVCTRTGYELYELLFDMYLGRCGMASPISFNFCGVSPEIDGEANLGSDSEECGEVHKALQTLTLGPNFMGFFPVLVLNCARQTLEP